MQPAHSSSLLPAAPTAASHWPLVQQAALEVHETSLQEVLAVLRGPAGFSTVVVEQEAALAGSSLHSVYCHRR